MQYLNKIISPFSRQIEGSAIFTDIDGTALSIKKKPDLVKLSTINKISFQRLANKYLTENSLFGFITGRGLVDALYIVLGLPMNDQTYILAKQNFTNAILEKIKENVPEQSHKLLDAYYSACYGNEKLFKGKYSTTIEVKTFQKKVKMIIEKADLPDGIFLEQKGTTFGVHYRELVENKEFELEEIENILINALNKAKTDDINLVKREHVIELWNEKGQKKDKTKEIKEICQNRKINKIFYGGDTEADGTAMQEIRKQLTNGSIEYAVTFFVKQEHNKNLNFLTEIHEHNYHHLVFENVKNAEKIYACLAK